MVLDKAKCKQWMLHVYDGTRFLCTPEDGIRDVAVTGVQTCALPISGLKVGELDILDGSPPCPPFSMSGTKQKGWNQERSEGVV